MAAVQPGNEPELAYKITDAAPYVPTLLAKDELLFLWSDKGVVSCVEAATGEQLWRERVGGNYSGSPVLAGDHLYCIAEDGTVVVLAASEKYELIVAQSAGRRQPQHAGHFRRPPVSAHLFAPGQHRRQVSNRQRITTSSKSTADQLPDLSAF